MRRCGTIANAHRSDASAEDGAVCSIAIADQVSRCFVPWKGLGDLASDPLGGRAGGDGDSQEPPTVVTKDHQAVEQAEGNHRDHEQVESCNTASMIQKKRLPTLRRR